MGKCDYILTLKGKDRVFESYNDLFKFLINNRNAINYGHITDIVYSLDKQKELEAKLKNISGKTKELVVEGVDKITEDLLYKKEDGFITVSDLMKNPESLLNNPFNIDDYKRIEIAKLKESGMNEVDATSEINSRLEHFEKVAERAFQIKSIIGAYFHNSNPMNLMNFIEEQSNYGFPFEFYSNIASQLDKIVDKIKSEHGDNVKLIPNLRLMSNLNGSDDKLLASVDLIAIDSNGVPHIYLFKNSEKVSEDWQAVREQDIDYRLGFYRHMLAANGINVKDSKLYTVPINIDLDEDTVYFEEPIDRLIPSKSGLNRLTWGSGSFYTNISNFVPITITDDVIVSDIRDNVLNNMDKALGMKMLQNTRTSMSIDEFIKSSRVRESDDYSKGKWMFLDITGTTAKPVYIKEDSPKEKNTELRNAVTAYLIKESKKYENAAEYLVKNITKAINGEIDFGTVYPNGTKPSYLSQILSKYTGRIWKVIDIPKLRDLGILGILNEQTHQIDFITISYHNGLNTPYSKFGLGTTLLGKFETDRSAKNKPNILAATTGNIELMKVLFAINEIPDLFNGIFKVGNILAINPSESSATKASQKELLTTFNSLVSHLNIKNNISDSIEFVDQFTILQQNFLSSLNDLKNTAALSRIKDQIVVSPTDRMNRLQIVNELIEALEKHYYVITSDPGAHRDSPIANLYINAWETKFYLEGDPFYQSHVLEKYNLSNGVAITAPSLIGDANLKVMNKWIANAFYKLNSNFNKFYQPFQNKYIRELLWKDKGYSRFESSTLGSQNMLYDNMILRDPKTGTINSMLMVKNPWTDNSLSNAEKKFLKKCLLEWNKHRYPNDLKNITDEESPLLKTLLENKEKAFWIPVVNATTAARWSQEGFGGIVKQMYNDIKDTKAYFQRTFENINSDSPDVQQKVKAIRNNQKELFDFFDPMEISEVDAAKRAEYIASRGLEFWSRNLEDVTLAYEFMNFRKDAYSEVLPKIKALRMAAMLYGDETGIDMRNFIEYLDNQTKIAIHNQTILNEESQKYAGAVAEVKYLASSMILGFNPKGLVREHLEGTWKLLLEGASKRFGSDAPTMKELLWAEKYIYSDLKDQPFEITKLELLNRLFRLNNLDINKLAERVRTNKVGLLNVTDRWMFFCNTAPDFRKRMVWLTAKLKHDGIWDAISVKDEQLVYDWRKDKRFDLLAKNKKSDPEYNKQLGLYLHLLNDINEKDGTNLKFGDTLPRMYTVYEITGIKNYSDMMFAFFDHETKPQIERNFVGMMLLQFQSYLSATKAAWCTDPGLYNLGKKVQATDEKTGKLIWLKPDKNEYGEDIYMPTLEETGIPFYTNQDSYFEGIAYSLKDIYNYMRKNGVHKGFVSIMSDPIKRSNIIHASMSLMLFTAIWGINKYLFELIASIWNEEVKGEIPSYSNALITSTGEFMRNCFKTSVGDLDIIGTVSNFISNPDIVSIATAKKLIDSTNDTIFGNMKLSKFLTTNIGVARTVSGAVNKFSEVYKFLNP